jgi:hypothetical protein
MLLRSGNIESGLHRTAPWQSRLSNLNFGCTSMSCPRKQPSGDIISRTLGERLAQGIGFPTARTLMGVQIDSPDKPPVVSFA